MSILRTHNLQNPDSSTINIVMDQGGNTNIAGITTVGSDLNISDKIIHTGDTDTAIRFPADDTITVETAGSERLRINSTGRVGIGTNIPTALLHLKSNAPYITFEDDDNNQDWQIQATAWFAIRDQTNNAERLRITSAGNVGIGTDNPTATLNIKKDGLDQIAFRITSDTGSANRTFSIKTPSSDSSIKPFVINTSNSLAFADDDVINMVIDASGEVGIGTDNPSSHLEVYEGTGSVYIKARAVTGDAVLNLHSPSDKQCEIWLRDDHGAGGKILYDHTDNYMAFFTQDTNQNFFDEKLRISFDGAFGIGGANYGTAGQVLTSGGGSAAPSWSGGATRVLEYVSAPCNGQTVLTSHGSKTTQDVGTAGYQLTTSYALLVGSMITYRPPTGTTTVIYRYAFQCSHHDTTGIAHFRFYIGSNEVTYARYTIRANSFSNRVVFEWPIKIGGTASAAIGQLASWNSDLTMKIEAREYSSSYDTKVNMTNHWDGAGTDQFSMPTISITALGS